MFLPPFPKGDGGFFKITNFLATFYCVRVSCVRMLMVMGLSGGRVCDIFWILSPFLISFSLKKSYNIHI